MSHAFNLNAMCHVISIQRGIVFSSLFYLCLIVNQKASSCWLCEESWVKLEITTLSVCTACTLAHHWPHFRAEWDLLISVYAACLEYSQYFKMQWANIRSAGLNVWIGCSCWKHANSKSSHCTHLFSVTKTKTADYTLLHQIKNEVCRQPVSSRLFELFVYRGDFQTELCTFCTHLFHTACPSCFIWSLIGFGLNNPEMDIFHVGTHTVEDLV